ncbi:MAG TPA: hypothetical protein VHG51_03205 [Longimicrobiaceae bacterium]|nr:hypothetical protein [Longimicrobiaceae bacterium]
MYEDRCTLRDDPEAPGAPRLLSTGELAEIEQRARGVGGSVIHVPTVLALAQRDVPALLAEVRRLRTGRGEPGGGD